MDTIAIRRRLMKRRRELLARYHGEVERADEELATRESEDVERSAEQWDAYVLSSLGDHDVAALADVANAIARLDGGTYGTCATCGTSIEEARLDALPTAVTCFTCADRRSTTRMRPPLILA